MNMTPTTTISDPRRQAALLYWQGYSVRQIAETLSIKTPTVQSWKLRDAWDDVAPISRVEASMEARLIQLILKEVKGNSDYKEIDALGRQIERLARVERYRSSGNEGDLNPNVRNRNKGERQTAVKNVFSDEQAEKLTSTGQSYEQAMKNAQRFNLLTQKEADGAVKANAATDRLWTVAVTGMQDTVGLAEWIKGVQPRLTREIIEWMKPDGEGKNGPQRLWDGMMKFSHDVENITDVVMAVANRLK